MKALLRLIGRLPITYVLTTLTKAIQSLARLMAQDGSSALARLIALILMPGIGIFTLRHLRARKSLRLAVDD